MYTLRCTQRLLTRLKGSREDLAIAKPNTLLGDWYANLLHLGRMQLVLAVSERTFLPAIISAAPSNTLVTRLRDHVVDVLRAVGVDSACVLSQARRNAVQPSLQDRGEPQPRDVGALPERVFKPQGCARGAS